MKNLIRSALSVFVLLSLVTGVIYPLVVTGLGKLIFPEQAAGSLIVHEGKILGSVLIGQNFSDPKYFWGRPSATNPHANNAAASTGSNQGPMNPALADAVKTRIEALRAADPGNILPVPVDLVTASASGLDPHISVAAAYYQADRIARVRTFPKEVVLALVQRFTEARTFGFLGESRVNILKLNLALDGLIGATERASR